MKAALEVPLSLDTDILTFYNAVIDMSVKAILKLALNYGCSRGLHKHVPDCVQFAVLPHHETT